MTSKKGEPGEMEKKKKKTTKRQKGLNYVREVKEILKRNGCDVEGPGWGLIFFGNKKGGGLTYEGKEGKEKQRPTLVHKDYFGCFDLISYRVDMGFIFHQVSILEEKAKKVDDLMTADKPGWIWGRFETDERRRIAYRLFSVAMGKVIEREEVVFVTETKQKGEAVLLDGAARKFEIGLF